MGNRTPSAPAGLDKRATKLWRDLHATWQFTPDELEILRLACEAVDRAEKAQAAIDEHGILVADRFGQLKENPACTIRNGAEANAARLLKQLGLKAEAERVLKNQRISSGVLRAHRRGA